MVLEIIRGIINKLPHRIIGIALILIPHKVFILEILVVIKLVYVGQSHNVVAF